MKEEPPPVPCATGLQRFDTKRSATCALAHAYPATYYRDVELTECATCNGWHLVEYQDAPTAKQLGKEDRNYWTERYSA